MDQFKHPTMNTLPLMLRGASKIGWYEGSGFFVIMSKSTSKLQKFKKDFIKRYERHSQLQVVGYGYL